MNLVFKTTKLRKQMSVEKKRQKTWGKEMSEKILLRLVQLQNAPNLKAHMAHQIPGRCHELKGDRHGQLALDLVGPQRLIFEVADDPKPHMKGGGVDYSKVSAVRALEVRNYHEDASAK